MVTLWQNLQLAPLEVIHRDWYNVFRAIIHLD